MSPDLRQIADIAPLLQSGALSPVALVQGVPRTDRCQARDQRVHHAARRAGAGRRRRLRARDSHGTLSRSAPRHSHLGERSDRRGRREDDVGVGATRTRGGVGRTRPSRGCGPPAQSSSARPTFTSSRSARRARSPPSVRCGIRTTRRARPAARAAAPPLPWRRACASARSAPIPAARSAYRRRPAARSGSRRPPARSRARASFRSAASLDHLGPMARSVADVALLFDVLTGRPPPDAARRAVTTIASSSACRDRTSATGSRPGSRQALERTCAALAPPVTRSATSKSITPRGRRTSTCTSCSRRRRAITRALSSATRLLYSPGVRVRLEMGRYLLAEDYVRAHAAARGAHGRGRSRARRAATRCCCPTLPIPAPLLGASTVESTARAEPVRAAMLRLTQLFNITGHPAIALPAPQTSTPLPRSVQIVGRRHQTDRLLAIGPPSKRPRGCRPPVNIETGQPVC